MASKEQPKSPLTVKFQQYELASGVAYYTILVTDIDYHKTWSLPKVRYSELRKLHLLIQSQYAQQLPDFPPKKFFGNLEPSFLSQRSKALEIYLNNTLKYFNINQLTKLKEFLCPQGLQERPTKEKQKPEETATPTIKETKSPQLGPQSTPKPQNQESRFSNTKMMSPMQTRPDLDQMIENIKVQFIYISNPSEHQQEPFESKNAIQLAKKKCIKNQQTVINAMNLNDIKKQNFEEILKEETITLNDRELFNAIQQSMNNININCSKLISLFKYINHEEPMDIIHYIQPQRQQVN